MQRRWAFLSNSGTAIGLLKEWAHEKYRGIPKCIDDLKDAELADILEGIAEDEHLSKVVDQALVGLDEADAEVIDRDVLGTDGLYYTMKKC